MMTDKDETIKRIEHQIKLGAKWDEAYRMISLDLLSDVLVLLKEQEITIKRQQDIIKIMESEKYDDYPLSKGR